MLTFKRLITHSLLCLIAICALVSASAMAQTTKQPETVEQESVLKALLNEMRLLRLALERNNMISHRSEVLLSRLRTQQERVDRLARDLEEARKQLSEMRYEPEVAAELIEDMQKKVEVGTMDDGPIKALQAEVARQERLRQHLVEREKFLAQELENEKSSLSELKIRLDALERLFDEVEDASKQLQKKGK
jgi:DNA repair exonuclease SbcCD ATPase subunit